MMIFDFLRYTQPWRRWVIKLVNLIWGVGNRPVWVLEWLYPPEMRVSFPMRSDNWAKRRK